MDVGVEEKEVAIEVIATLVNIKDTMCNRILKPAGVPSAVYLPLLKQRHYSGRFLSKRELAPLILDAIKHRQDYSSIMRKIIEIAANWDDFDLAQDERDARGTVQMARKVLGILRVLDEEEARQRERKRQEELAQKERKRAEEFRKELNLLLMMFDDLYTSTNAQRRGYQLQELLHRTFILHDIPVEKSFIRNQGGEQIDGAFSLGDWYYLVECRWRKEPADIRQLDGLLGQLERSGKPTMGLFLSINGWSENVPPILKQNLHKSIILMDGFDLRCVLDGRANLRDFLRAKLSSLSLEGEPFFSAYNYLNR